jgi:tetratricopeptide (TPR) repeat protein
MQNITSRYNYIYNANVLLNNYISELQESYLDNYTGILPIYVGPEKFNALAANLPASPLDSTVLDDIIRKAKTIIADKSYGNYIDDAYMLLGKSYYYKANYFIAAEYFEYTASTYRSDNNILLDALNWKARCELQLNNLPAAAAILDSLEATLGRVPKQSAAPSATLSQISIALNDTKAAITYLKSAIKASNKAQDKNRWTYILAQLYEAEHDTAAALTCYKTVQNSNAGFNLYFNARLNAIRLTGMLNPLGKSRLSEMLSLVKDDKNAEFLDQVYYHLGETYAAGNDYPNAIEYYNRSVHAATTNAHQKGLSYLRLADLNFNTLRDYLKAKAYYDSTLITLPKSHSQYLQIAKKVQNLQYLTDRYQTIALQDTLQALAKIPMEERLLRIQAFQPVTSADSDVTSAPLADNAQTSNRAGQFYFQNPTALRSGLVDFHKRWGNRLQEDNWRQSIRVADQTNTIDIVAVNTAVDLRDSTTLTTSLVNDQLVQRYLNQVPVNSEMLQQSNQQIIDAYFQLAAFYQQELKETDQAIRIYELLLSRFPGNNYTAAINYSLYLAYKNSAPEKAKVYKDIVVSSFGESIYARTILDPAFSLKQNESDLALNVTYDSLFTTYQRKDFTSVVKKAGDITSAYPNNRLAPQFDYLQAISKGHLYPIDTLLHAFQALVKRYPSDRLIVPLVSEHLGYINSHLDEFRKRTVALIDFDPNETPFAEPLTAAKPLEPVKAPAAVAPLPAERKPEVQESIETRAATSTFSNSDSATYYFVIDVADATVRLSASRFGIGQFNRGNYPTRRLRHQITEFDDDQLIYVGNFSSFEDAKAYADGIIPQLNRIMKVPESKYTAFIISKENFEKLNSKVLVNGYLEFYKNNY